MQKKIDKALLWKRKTSLQRLSWLKNIQTPKTPRKCNIVPASQGIITWCITLNVHKDMQRTIEQHKQKAQRGLFGCVTHCYSWRVSSNVPLTRTNEIKLKTELSNNVDASLRPNLMFYGAWLDVFNRRRSLDVLHARRNGMWRRYNRLIRAPWYWFEFSWEQSEG